MADPQRLYCDSDTVVELTGCTDEQAERAVTVGSAMIDAYCTVPIPEPTPPPVQQACLSLAVGLVTASPGGAVISETVGAYSYRLAAPKSLSLALVIDDVVAGLLRPWRPRVYDVRTPSQTGASWPVDWWQRNLDEVC